MHAVIPSGWRLVLAIALFAGVLLSTRARPPRQAAARSHLRCLVLAAFLLYAAGTAAWLAHRAALATGVLAVGVAAAALAAWLSRGTGPRGGEDRRGAEPDDGAPPQRPVGPEPSDWDAFERAFRDYAARPRTPAGVPD